MKKRRSESNRATQHEFAYLYATRPFKWFWDLIRPIRGRYLLAILIDLVCVTAGLLPATVTGRLVDDVLTARRLDLLSPYIALLIGVPLVRSCLAVLYRFHFESSSQTTIMSLRESLYRHLQNLDATFYNRSRTGDIMSKMTGDIDMIRHFIAYTAYATVENVVLFVFGALYVFSISWKLALVAIALTPFILVITYRLGKSVRPIWSEIREAFSRLNSVVQQNIAGNRVVRAFARADFEEKKFETENDSYRKANVRHAQTVIRYLPVLDALANFLTVPVILVGGILVIRGELTLGGLVTFNGLLFVLNNPMRNAGNLMNEIQRYAASAAKVIDLLIERPRIVNPAPDQPETGRRAPLRGKVEFRDVTFTYGERKGHNLQPSLKNISLVAEPGQTIGIIGLTGSGKTSLVNLIPRLYDTTFGAILIDDVDVRDYNLQELRRSIGMVMQDVFLFSDTVEGNIAYGVPEAPQALVEESARLAAADGFIRHMTEGYDTIVGERGVGLSGGQRQRIALARALAMEPRILILDDTTSAVDMETEHEIQQALKQKLTNQTVFMIAHRISSVRHADQIIVLDQGQIVEQGVHDELMARQGIYYDVFMTQAGLNNPDQAKTDGLLSAIERQEGGERLGT